MMGEANKVGKKELNPIAPYQNSHVKYRKTIQKKQESNRKSYNQHQLNSKGFDRFPLTTRVIKQI